MIVILIASLLCSDEHSAVYNIYIVKATVCCFCYCLNTIYVLYYSNMPVCELFFVLFFLGVEVPFSVFDSHEKNVVHCSLCNDQCS